MTTGDVSIFHRRWLPLTATIVVMIGLTAFNVLAVVAALPQITAELGSVSLLPWVVTGFLLTATVSTVVAGPLIDAFGVRAVFRATMVTFLLGSLASAAAPSMTWLVVFRGLQGVGTGLSFSVASAAVGLTYPERLRPRALAALSVTWGFMALGGPAVAAVFVATTGWRGIFLANIPIGLLAAAIGWVRLPRGRENVTTGSRIDWRGLGLITAFTTISLLGLSSLSIASAAALAASLLLALAYWWHSGTADRPMLGRRYFASHPIGTANIAFGLAVGAALGVDAYLPVYVTAGLGHGVVVAAFSVAFLTVGWTAASLIVSRVLDRFSEMPTAIAGFILLLPPLAVGATVFDADTPLFVVFSVAFALGLGVGTISMAILNLLYLVADEQEVGRATAAHTYARGLFQAYATAVVGAVILLVVGNEVGDIEVVRELLSGDQVAVAPGIRASVARGIRLGHTIPLGLTALGLFVAFRLQRRLGHPLRKSPVEAD